MYALPSSAPAHLAATILRVYRELETAGQGVVLVAAVEPDSARAADAKSNYAIPVFSSIEELLAANLRLDAATVAVPTVYHHAVASVLLQAGLDLLVEKPIAATLAELMNCSIWP